ncbi:hypothetical protein [Vibrio sp. 10N.261.46.A3]|uniref:hypothetical protein n=1 Tax=Vibrio sp. 10N.261.46.A3 TaxID=3229658 RepID=UPI00354ED364
MLSLLGALSASASAKVTYADVEASMALEDQRRPPHANDLDPVGAGELPTGSSSDGEWVAIYKGNTQGRIDFDGGAYSAVFVKSSKGESKVFASYSEFKTQVYASDHNNVSFHSDADCSALVGYGFATGCRDTSHGQSANVHLYEVWGLKN